MLYTHLASKSECKSSGLSLTFPWYAFSEPILKGLIRSVRGTSKIMRRDMVMFEKYSENEVLGARLWLACKAGS